MSMVYIPSVTQAPRVINQNTCLHLLPCHLRIGTREYNKTIMFKQKLTTPRVNKPSNDGISCRERSLIINEPKLNITAEIKTNINPNVMML